MKNTTSTFLPGRTAGAARAGAELSEATVWYWSPSAFWKFEGDGVRIGSSLVGGIARGLFPDFYFLAQQGATLESLREAFSSVPQEELRSILGAMISEKTLVDSLLSLPEVFQSQKSLFQHGYGDSLLYDAALYGEFKKSQLLRKPPVASAAPVTLDPGAWEVPASLADRRSHRHFDPKPVPFAVFSRAISVFRSVDREGEPHRYYPTTGGLCGMDVYVSVKEGRISGITEGIYFYDPRQNSLHRVGQAQALGKEIHHHTNRAMAAAAAFTLLLVFNAEVTMPVYGPVAYALACVETGIMLATFNHTAENLGLGICPVGLVDFERAEEALALKRNHKLLHLAECGLKTTEAPTTRPETRLASPDATEPRSQDAPSISDLRRFLSETLPDYMVPSDFLLVDSIPLTPNNKVDREALLRMAPVETLGLGTAFVPPESELEEAVLGIWRKLIRGRDVGVEDNFFDLGGDSMGVAEAHREIMEQFKIDLPIVKLFQHPTVRSTARFLRSQLQASPSAVRPASACLANAPACPAPSPARALTEPDRGALAWLRANPGHPRAAAVASKLKSRGLL
jgi:SagB-type dehydrogenase family enzyme